MDRSETTAQELLPSLGSHAHGVLFIWMEGSTVAQDGAWTREAGGQGADSDAEGQQLKPRLPPAPLLGAQVVLEVCNSGHRLFTDGLTRVDCECCSADSLGWLDGNAIHWSMAQTGEKQGARSSLACLRAVNSRLHAHVLGKGGSMVISCPVFNTCRAQHLVCLCSSQPLTGHCSVAHVLEPRT